MAVGVNLDAVARLQRQFQPAQRLARQKLLEQIEVLAERADLRAEARLKNSSRMDKRQDGSSPTIGAPESIAGLSAARTRRASVRALPTMPIER
jgi:hypothetical protein